MAWRLGCQTVRYGAAELAFWLSLGLLAPVIAWQGRRVRRNTLRLPEPAGKRDSVPESGPNDYRVLIVGDSAAAGVGVAHQSQALLGQLVERLNRNTGQPDHKPPVAYRLMANTGDALADVLARQLSSAAPVHPSNSLGDQASPAAERFDLVLVSVGVNDVTGFTSLAQWQRGLLALNQTLQQGHSPSLVLFTQVPPMHHFPALPHPLRGLLGWRARQLNRVLADTLGPSQLLTVNIPFDDAYMAEDGFHPGELGYGIWAEAVVQRLNRP